jgi:Methyltransferase domain/Domain of unknown function (DUF4214)
MDAQRQTTNQNELIDKLFLGLLGRKPDEEAIEFYSSALARGKISVADLVRNITDSDEFLRSVLRRRDLSVFRTQEVARNSRFSELSVIPEHGALNSFFSTVRSEDFESIYSETLSRSTLPASREYVKLHKERFRETLSFVSSQADDHGFLLEVSTSPYTPFLKRLYRGNVVTADHESIHPGIDNAPVAAINSDLHIAANLNSTGLSQRAKNITKGRGFDLILFCEIIEHLLPSPFDLVRDLGECLRPGGKLLISTPNFFSFDRMIKMMHHQHPNQLLRPGDSFAFGGHHVREYSMDELIEIVKVANLKLCHFGFSACWDSDPVLQDFVDLHPGERSCLMVVCERVT